MARVTRRLTPHRLVRFIEHRLEVDQITYKELARRAGIHHVKLNNWRQGASSPNLDDLEVVLKTLGYNFAALPLSMYEKL